jgi:DNA-binding MarR family transcriptional regulator
MTLRQKVTLAEVEIIARVERRRKWTAEERAALLAEVEAEGGKVSVVARRARGATARAGADPKGLAARLKIAPQTGTAVLRELAVRGVVKEVTGRGDFRAFAI